MSMLDAALAIFFNQLTGRSWAVDSAMYTAAVNDLVKGAPLVALLWGLWFWRGEAACQACRRQAMLAGLLGVGLALAIARLLVLARPYRARPLHDPTLDLAPPIGLSPQHLDGQSTFPSDHAALYLGLAAVALLISRRWGLAALAYALLVVCLPRLFLGLHFASDVLVGAALGIGLVLLARRLIAHRPLIGALAHQAERAPHWFYPLFFLASFELATTFDSARDLGRFMVGLANVVAALL